MRTIKSIYGQRHLGKRMVAAIGLAGLPWLPAAAGAPGLQQGELDRVMGTLRAKGAAGPSPSPGAASARPRFRLASKGRVRHLAAPSGMEFKPEVVVPGDPESTAGIFLESNRKLFGMESPNIKLLPRRTASRGGRTYVRFRQDYRGIPVFGAETVVQLNGELGVEFVGADLSLELGNLDAQAGWPEPELEAGEAAAIVSTEVSQIAGGLACKASAPQLMVFAPEVIGAEGPPVLVWVVEVGSAADASLNETWMVDARTGAVVRRIARAPGALNRRIRDAENDEPGPNNGTLVRAEGDGPSGIADADAAYRLFKGTYDFYADMFGLDSYNDSGATIRATVRVCMWGEDNNGNRVYRCPWRNAQWTGKDVVGIGKERFEFGLGYVVDDVVAHEFTHAVIDFSSNLIYENVSGAINESLADVFGEFVDLTNGTGTDTPQVRWLVGEELPFALRNMADPPAFRNTLDGTRTPMPDRRNSPDYYTGSDDDGGVHHNSSVNNKLCYLLTDGDTFNGETVDGMGIDKVAHLYFEANSLLPKGADWTDLFEALRQAAVNLGWSNSERANLYYACRAVEIAAPEDLYVDGDSSCNMGQTGFSGCLITLGGPFRSVTRGVRDAHPGDRLLIRGGTYDEGPVTIDKLLTIEAVDSLVTIGK